MVSVHKEEVVGPDSESGLVGIANRNGMASVKGTNQNEAEGAAF